MKVERAGLANRCWKGSPCLSDRYPGQVLTSDAVVHRACHGVGLDGSADAPPSDRCDD